MKEKGAREGARSLQDENQVCLIRPLCPLFAWCTYTYELKQDPPGKILGDKVLACPNAGCPSRMELVNLIKIS